MSTVEEIRSSALGLPDNDRALLARDLILSLESAPFHEDAEAAWAGEIRARSAAVHRGEFTASEWRESVERIRAALTQRRSP